MVKRFFATHGRAGLVLPDGWYGRDFDSLFSLTAATDVHGGFEIEIEGGRMLHFLGSSTVVKTRFDKHPALRIEGFQSMKWVPQDGVSEERLYHGVGAVIFVA